MSVEFTTKLVNFLISIGFELILVDIEPTGLEAISTSNAINKYINLDNKTVIYWVKA